MVLIRESLKLCLLAALLYWPSSVFAASPDGDFAVKDVGLLSCRDFVTAREQRSEQHTRFVGWLAGFFSAYNQFTEDTVDIAPWQSIGLLDLFTANHCRRNPDIAFITAVNQMIAGLKPDRLQASSENIDAKVDSGESVSIYRTVLEEVQRRLSGLGMYAGKIDGSFGPTTQVALEKFQRSNGLAITGLPDEKTLTSLLLSN